MSTPSQIKNTKDIHREDTISQKIDLIISWVIQGTQVDGALIKQQILSILKNPTAKGALSKATFYINNLDSDLYHLLPDILKADPEIAFSALRKNSKIYHLFSGTLKNNPKIVQLYFQNMLLSSSLIDIIDFIELHKENKKLYIELKKSFETSLPHIKSSRFIALWEIYIVSPGIYKKIKDACIFSTFSGEIIISEIFVKSCITELEKSELQEEQKAEYLEQKILRLIWVTKENIPESLQKLLIEIIGVIMWASLQKQKKYQKQKEAAIKKQEEQEKQKEKNSMQKRRDEDAEILSESFPNYTPIAYSSCVTMVSINGQDSVTLEKNIAENINETSLENYISFLKILTHLWLRFLIDSHRDKLSIAMKLDFFEWGGMSEARILRFFNSLGKNLWVPEKSFQSDPENPQLSCFDTLWSAKLVFGGIASSGKINRRLICPVSQSGGMSIVEIYMKQIWLIIPPYAEISLANWK